MHASLYVILRLTSASFRRQFLRVYPQFVLFFSLLFFSRYILRKDFQLLLILINMCHRREFVASFQKYFVSHERYIMNHDK